MTSTIRDILTAHQSGTSIESTITTATQQAEANTHHASTETFTTNAIEIAKKQDKKPSTGLLAGVPFGVKDCFMVQGTKTSAGSHILSNYQSPYTATAIQNLLDEGAILITKENMDQFGHGSTSENSAYPATTNAHIPGAVAGGSSGGSAVNVAIGVTTFSIGEDTGGSIRQPAGYNQVVGFKPTYGAISRHGVISYASSLDTVGPITNNVYDAALITNILAKDTTTQQNTHDMTKTPYPALDLTTINDIDLSKLTIGYYKSFLNHQALDPSIKQATQNVLDTLAEKGATIKELDMFSGDLLVATYYTLALAETASELARIDGVKYGQRSEEAHTREEIYYKSRGEGFSKETQKRIVLGSQILSAGFDNKYYTKACIAREKLIAHYQQNFDEVDFIISPVTPNLVPQKGASLKDPLQMYMSDLYTVGFSLGGLPTLSVALGSPTGIQITGNTNDDHNVLRLGHTLEQHYLSQN